MLVPGYLRRNAPVISTIVAGAILSLFIAWARDSTYFTSWKRPVTPMIWSSSLSGFLNRADEYGRPGSEFKPPRSSLELAYTYTAMLDPDGFGLAIFQSDGSPDSDPSRWYAVDTYGRILHLQAEDVAGLQTLFKRVREGVYFTKSRGWELEQRISCMPGERLVFPKEVGSLPPVPSEDPSMEEFKIMGVSGFDYSDRRLVNPVDGLKEIPEELFELMGLVWEGLDGPGSPYAPGAPKNDEVVLNYVRNMLGERAFGF
ncbi:hypothetical protein D9611_009850 [Ephemerocybe angulata]|uniref:Uncharacterized protein n=1 Tax=Ephemerocybe angulata TaxID=980116 RepID=A0A8H5CE09_9AGAR|nr:hypothetical protein D9611_009850 [Tulosesus angulatus]